MGFPWSFYYIWLSNPIFVNNGLFILPVRRIEVEIANFVSLRYHLRKLSWMTSALTGGKRVKPNLELAEGAERWGGLDQMLKNCIFTGGFRIFLLHNAALCWQVNLFRFADVIYDSSLSSKQDDLAIDLETSLTFLVRGNQLVITLVNAIDSMYILIWK